MASTQRMVAIARPPRVFQAHFWTPMKSERPLSVTPLFCRGSSAGLCDWGTGAFFTSGLYGIETSFRLSCYNTLMSLYRKYRPANFKEVIGQGSVVDVLARAIKDKTIAHAYLFTGSRGTGKTSVARILAKDIGTAPEDLYEIDAASNRGIDEIRELREAVRTLPFNSKYKVGRA